MAVVPITDQPEAPAANVVEALSRVMRDLPAIGKEGTGPAAQGSYKFRGVEQIVRHAVPLFARHGVLVTPHRVDLRKHTDVMSGGKPAVDERVLVTYRIYGPGGIEDYIEIQAPGVGRDTSDKGSNKAMTAAYKYALTQTLGVADAKDDGDWTSLETDVIAAPSLPPGVDPEAIDEVTATVAVLSDDQRERFVAWKAGQGFPYPWPAEACAAMMGELARIVQADAIDLAATPCALCGSTRSRRVLGAGDVVRCSETKGCEERQAALEAPFSEATT